MTIRLDELGIGEEWPEGLTIVYDGDCPVCRAYSQYARLRSTFDTVSLVNVREQPRLAAILYAHGIDLDDGWATVFEGSLYLGSEAIAFVAKSSKSENLFDRIWLNMMRSEARARRIYPYMRGSRNLVLRVLMRSKLNEK